MALQNSEVTLQQPVVAPFIEGIPKSVHFHIRRTFHYDEVREERYESFYYKHELEHFKGEGKRALRRIVIEWMKRHDLKPEDSTPQLGVEITVESFNVPHKFHESTLKVFAATAAIFEDDDFAGERIVFGGVYLQKECAVTDVILMVERELFGVE